MLPEHAALAARAAVTDPVNCPREGTSTALSGNAVLSSPALPLWVLKCQNVYLNIQLCMSIIPQ